MSSNYQTLGTSVVEYDIDNGVVKSYDGFDIGCKYAHVATGDDEYIYVGSADGAEVATISRMDKKTGEIEGKNCHDSEKVRRFYEQYPDSKTENFYSDSLSDTPMAEIAERAWLVSKHKLSPWPEK